MDNRINEKIGAWLLIEGNTRDVLASAIGISRPALNRRMNGKSKWKWEDVLAVSKLTGCSLNELAGIPG